MEVTNGNFLNFGNENDQTFSGVISGEGGIEKLGSGIVTFTGANVYTGTTTISAGTLRVSGLGSLSDNTDVINSSSGTYDVDVSDTIKSLSGTGGVDIASGVTLTLGDDGDHEIGGVISGGGGLTKVGTGTLTLSGVNTYDGITTINAGKISISASTGLGANPGDPTADNIVFDGGTLQTTQNITLHDNKGITLTGNGELETDDSTTLTYGGIITGAGGLTKTGSGTLTFLERTLTVDRLRLMLVKY